MKPNDLAPPQGDNFKFNEVGDTIEGTIVYVGDWAERTNKFSGKLEEVTKIGILVDGNSEPTYIWPVKGSGMASGLADGLRDAGLPELAEGQRLKLRFDQAVPTDKGNPFKKYRARITAGEPVQKQPDEDPF